jgi:hypothetical protein
MDRRDRVDHQRSDRMDHRKHDNDELESMPLLDSNSSCVESVRYSRANVQMYDLDIISRIYIYRWNGSKKECCRIIRNVLEYSCLIVVIRAFSLSLLFFLSVLFFSHSSPFLFSDESRRGS